MIPLFSREFSSFERRAAFAIIALQIALISLPYFWALSTTPEGFVYGGLLFNPDDQNVHLSWARQAAEGHFFFRDLFTTESLISGERPLFTNALAWLLGALSNLTKIPLVWMYHIFRVVFAALTLLLFHALCVRLSKDARVRIVALALAAFAGGAGFLAPLLPARNWMDRPDNPGFPMMPEAFTFASSYIFTLNISSMALLLAVYLFAFRAWETGSRRAAVAAGGSTLLLGNIHTYDVFPLILALVIWAIWTMRSTPAGSTPEASNSRARWLFLPCIFVGATVPVAYQLWVFRGSEEFRVKALTKTLAPPVWDVVISYGPLFLLAAIGALMAWREVKTRLPICWTIATLILIYAPVSFARKMIEGLHLPLCFLAAIAIVALLSKLPSPGLKRTAAAGVILILSLSSFHLIAWSLNNARDNNFSRAGVLMPPLYLPLGDARAMEFLKAAPHGKVVLCLPFMGNYIPRETGQTAFIGHWAETLHFQEKLEQTLGFYSGQMSAAQARAWLRENRIDYVLIGSYEEQLGAQVPLELPVLHNENGATIYAAP